MKQFVVQSNGQILYVEGKVPNRDTYMNKYGKDDGSKLDTSGKQK
jgi:hypothetical protein